MPVSKFPFLQPSSDSLGAMLHYRVEKLIGEGGMGYVFKGSDTRLQRPVALKVLKPEIAIRTHGHERFMREARAMAAIQHPNVVTIFHVDRQGEFPFFAMELLEGETLADRLTREKTLPLDVTLRLTRQMLLGLQAAHQTNLIHRDIK
ncbi:MAG: serine/threonine-protein kinase, partial [Planctomycetota bacterium]